MKKLFCLIVCLVVYGGCATANYPPAFERGDVITYQEKVGIVIGIEEKYGDWRYEIMFKDKNRYLDLEQVEFMSHFPWHIKECRIEIDPRVLEPITPIPSLPDLGT